jgi:protein arginine kinase
VSLRDIIGKTLSEWMKGTGPESDIVLSSRIRLARNLALVPFPATAQDSQKRHVVDLIDSVVKQEPVSPVLQNVDFVRLAEISPLERQLLVEKHLISPQHAHEVRHKAVILRDDEAVSIMVNEEDHLRHQTLFPGLQLQEAWKLCSKIDDAFAERLELASSVRWGFLTACPTNVGTGMRASIMMHLPALSMKDQMKRVATALSKFGVTVRGIYGEGTDVLGNVYQISNQVTLGQSEEEIIEHLVQLTRQILEQERNTREQIRSRNRIQLEDRIFRSYGVLTNARTLSTHEAMQLLSDVRMGIDMGLVKGLEPRILQELMVMIRPAHLQKLMGSEVDAPQRDIWRATFIRERMKLVA